MTNSTCSAEECITQAKARGWCMKHYQQQYKGQPLVERKSVAKCPHCGNEFDHGNNKTYCSRQCREGARYASIKSDAAKWSIELEKARNAYVKVADRPGYKPPKVILCSESDCDRPKVSRGMCQMHYRRTVPRPPDKAEHCACVVCGTNVTRSPSKRRVYGATCSDECRRALTFGERCELPADHMARWVGATCTWRAPKPKPARFIAATCADCDTAFICIRNGDQALYCSRSCARRVGKRRRRAREYGATGEYRYSEVMRQYAKQGRVCAYCKAKPEGLPDPEHVLALSRGGRNDMTNLVASCRPCNADKGDLTLDEWAESRQWRGLPVVDVTLESPEYRHLMRENPERPAWRHQAAA